MLAPLWLAALVVATTIIGCSRGSTPAPRPQRAEAGNAEASEDAASSADADSGGDAAATDEAAAESWTGIRGLIKALEGSAAGSAVLVAIPDSEVPPRLSEADGEGAFKIRDLDPGTYRLILPADGVHATADMYVTVVAGSEPTEVVIPRSKGCPVKITVRDHDQSAISGAEVELALPDLPQVRERHLAHGTTNSKGLIVLTSSCVRGFFEGTLAVPDRRTFEVRHGYVGTGYDQFDIVLPEDPDAGVSYANDD
jgi:hypothetical protein